MLAIIFSCTILQNRITKLERVLEESEKRQKSSYSQALQAVKKYMHYCGTVPKTLSLFAHYYNYVLRFKTRAQQASQEKLHIQEELESEMVQITFLLLHPL